MEATLTDGDVNVLKGGSHCFQWVAAAVDAECHGTILMASDSLDRRVLHPGLSQVINQSVAERVNGALGIGDT